MIMKIRLNRFINTTASNSGPDSTNEHQRQKSYATVLFTFPASAEPWPGVLALHLNLHLRPTSHQAATKPRLTDILAVPALL